MKILVTVGTTPFDALIQAADQIALAHPELQFQFQIATGDYTPAYGHSISFGDIAPMYEWADLIISHAGAGTVYQLLEEGKRLIVVPNLTRRDPHQSELAWYVEIRKFAPVCWDLVKLESIMLRIEEFPWAPYARSPFFLAEELQSLLAKSLPTAPPLQ